MGFTNKEVISTAVYVINKIRKSLDVYTVRLVYWSIFIVKFYIVFCFGVMPQTIWGTDSNRIFVQQKRAIRAVSNLGHQSVFNFRVSKFKNFAFLQLALQYIYN